MIEHWHILVTRGGEDVTPRSYCAFQTEGEARENLQTMFGYFTRWGAELEPPWGSIVSPSGNEGWVTTHREYQTRGMIARKRELVSSERVFWELSRCSKGDCDLYDPQLAEVREAAFGIALESRQRKHKQNIEKYGLGEAHQREIFIDNSEAVDFYAESLRRLREQHADYPLLLRNLELNADYRRGGGAHRFEYDF